MKREQGTVGRRLPLAILLTALVILVTLLGSGTVLAADRWSDITDQQWISTYHVTAAEAATVAEGYPDGTFKPGLAVNREQFAKMVVDGFDLATASPATPTFTDVPTTNFFYRWIEGGVDAGIISGFPDGTYRPASAITRQQANSILGLHLAEKELSLRGHIAGDEGNYVSLNAWYLAEGEEILEGFADASSVSSVHAAATAYLAYHDVVQGSPKGTAMYLSPTSNLTRAQAVALILRVKAVTFSTALPTVTLLAPASGPTAGGNTVVITGTNFTDATVVKFGTVKATTFTVNSAIQITATAPAGTSGTTVDVTVTTPAGTSATTGTGNDYTYGVPTVTAVSPTGQATTAAGTAVTITGTNFVAGATVAFGAAAATSVVVVNATTITCVSPAHAAGVVDVTVTTPAGTSATTGTGNDYTYGVPTVTAVSPTGQATTAAGTAVTITGTNFVAGATVAFGAAAATSVVVVNATTITCVSPAHAAGVVDVTVTTPAGTSATTGTGNDYTYGVPTVTAVSPTGQATTAAGTAVTITGTNFVAGATVAFGAAAATSVVVVNATTITCVSPAHAAGVVDVTVTTPAGTSAVSAADKYTYGMTTKFAVTMSGGTTALSAAAKTAGTPFDVRVTAQDASGNTVPGYTGTVHLTSNAFAGTVNATITSGGLVDSIAITPTVAGTGRMIDATDGTITTTNASGNFTVDAAATTKFAVTMSGGTTALSAAAKTAGTPFDVRVTAQDASGNTVPGYTGTVHLTSNAFAGTVNATITSGGLVDSIAITPTVAGTGRMIDATDGTITTTNASGNFTVDAAATTKFAVTMSGGTTALSAAAKTAGTPFDVRVTAQDASGNTVPGYTGTVHLTSNAFAGTVNATITSGGLVDSIAITPTVAGTGRMIDATDGTITTTNASGNFTVDAAATTKFAVTMSGGTTALSAAAKTAGTPFDVRVTAQDASGNTVPGYTGTVHLTSNAFAGTVNATITSGGLVDSIAITPTVAGTGRMIDATDGTITTTNASGNFTVDAAATTKFAVTMSGGTTALSAAAKTAGTPFDVRVTAQDASGNTVPGYTGTVHLTSNAFAGTVNATITSGGLVDSIAITPTVAGTGRMIDATDGTITTTNASGNFTVTVAAAKMVIETAADGTGTVIGAETIPVGYSGSVYAIARDASNNFVANVAATWSLTNKTDGVVDGDLVPAADGKSAVFTGNVPGTGVIHAAATMGGFADDTGIITVAAGTASHIRIENKADGTGTVIGAETIPVGYSGSVYAIARDASNNFVANVAATWSLTNKTDGVVDGDLVPAADGKSAVFTGNVPGTGVIHAAATMGGFADDTGIITVTVS